MEAVRGIKGDVRVESQLVLSDNVSVKQVLYKIFTAETLK